MSFYLRNLSSWLTFNPCVFLLVGSQHLFKVSEQSFIYEACANLIMACATTNDGGGVDESARLFASLLATPLMAIPKMVRLLAEEKIREMAEARGSLIKQTIDLIT